MRPALSVRIGESPRDKSRLAASVDELLALAAAEGFEGISVRASAVSVDSSRAAVATFANALHRNGLVASMVTGDLPLAANNSDATRALHRITPYLDLAEALGAKMVRVMLHGEHDIPLAQQAADEAALRGITLAQQCHWGSMAETVEQALSLASKVARDNFGITYEPANLLASGGPFGADAVTRLQSVMVNVYYQNICLDEQAALKFPTRVRGDVGVRFLPLADPAGIDTAPLVRALREIDYTGWFTVHQPLLAGETLGDVIKGAGALIRTL